ncbi:MAG: DUF4838 domain-containing protein [Thermoguttaceae bacterium]|nr:DUF4838 domain-containing protein [Thermoguttaceae bacterium]
MRMPREMLLLAAMLLLPGRAAVASAEGRVELVRDGAPAAVVVIADTPSRTAAYAAQELVNHIEHATGGRLPVVAEADVPEDVGSRIFVGMTAAARAQGIVAEALGPEEFVLRSAGADLYIVGDEDEGDPLSPYNSKCGTLFGVYELLERCAGVRWLWPGALGTYIPPTDTVKLDAVDERIAPRLAFREIAWGRVRAAAIRKTEPLTDAEKILGFSPEGLSHYGHDLQDYLRRHRMGGMDRKPSTGHHFSGWWERYGEKHPEWFMMHEDGTRGPSKRSGTRQVPMCVSNPELHRFIVERWDGKSTIRLGEVDWPDACRCPACRAWDSPQPDPLPGFLTSQIDSGNPESSRLQVHRSHVLRGFYDPMCTSDRYARFWQAVRKRAAERNPEALVTTYIYYGYFPAPATDIELGEHVFGEFVPWGNPQHTDFFPMREEALAWLKEQWLGWRRTGMRLAYRPNYLHDGWVMPLVDVRQAAEFFQFAVENGMEGSRFDSLTGQWAVHGPKLYVHMRLHAKPELAVDDILDEYYEAFGPAAPEVREYFEYWERYCADNLQKINDLYIDVGHRWARFLLMAHKAFPPASFEAAEAILQRAKRAAADHPRPEYAARVAFVAAGLEHARLAGRLAALFDGDRNIPADSERFEQAVEALRELVAFRRAHEKPYISDYLYGAAGREARFWNLRPLFARLEAGEPVEGGGGLQSEVEPAESADRD